MGKKFQLNIGLYLVGSKELKGKEREAVFSELPGDLEIEIHISGGDIVERRVLLYAQKKDFGKGKSLGYYANEKVIL